ncbi:diguanylate cyclase [Cupriavidus basilensis]
MTGFGHAAGDRALAHIASLLSRETRQTDVVGRIGGEEFALLLPRTGKGRPPTSQTGCAESSRPLFHAIRPLISCCTVSAGVEEFDACDSLASVMARADAALYAAKADGRNRVMLVGENRQFQPVEAPA